MKLYAIYDPESDLYVTRGIQPKLAELGVDTLFFKKQSEAMRRIEMRRFGLEHTCLQTDLAWWLLEKAKGTDRWHVNVGLDEYYDAADQFKNLRVEEICLERNLTKRQK